MIVPSRIPAVLTCGEGRGTARNPCASFKTEGDPVWGRVALLKGTLDACHR